MLIQLLGAVLAFGDLPVLDGADLTLTAGDRVGLIGRNGTGKSSLLGVLQGRIALDDGRVVRRDGLSIATVEQEPLLPEAPTLREALALRGDLEAIGEHDDRRRWALVAAFGSTSVSSIGARPPPSKSTTANTTGGLGE